MLKAADAATRDSRLALCDLTARVLKQDLETPAVDRRADVTGKEGEEFLRSHASARFIFGC